MALPGLCKFPPLSHFQALPPCHPLSCLITQAYATGVHREEDLALKLDGVSALSSMSLSKLLASHQRACAELPKLQETHGDCHGAIVSRCV